MEKLNEQIKSQFIIAAPSSNAGKTTVTLGLLRLFKEKGISVQPFKVGPDFIDPKFHYQACGKTGLNLDMFMMSDEHIKEQFYYHSQDNQVSCIEGVMGLFDGARKAKGSAADLAIKLDIPVILVIDAKSVAYSVAPLIKGFKEFDDRLNLLGVIFNRVGSEHHYSFLKDACEDVGVRSFGYVKRLEDLEIPSRHLGLNIDNINQFDRSISALADEMETTIDYNSLLQLTQISQWEVGITQSSSESLKISIAQDAAFNFIYPQHIEKLKEIGEVTFFSPLRDEELPESDFVYFPGGYPECHLQELSKNQSMLASIRNYCNIGGLGLAECGGLMYLGKSITNEKGDVFEMTNVFDFETSMAESKLHLGYRHIDIQDLQLKGHEFHYSTILPNETSKMESVIKNAREKEVNTAVYRRNNFIASYIHFYLGEKDTFRNLINKLRA
ncbi:cobyrinate a,c-diamide synthase [Reichenbachiella versicolor]|uniref:cobyrinate a,c-diamide synthase n=1 Tax=Reichenbachiella versicolor TaxID=1821036 RepID=UPI000D6E03D6|nr:cobyrinate a,c-diamide synthase [Reichenbachiella versicolor]